MILFACRSAAIVWPAAAAAVKELMDLELFMPNLINVSFSLFYVGIVT